MALTLHLVLLIIAVVLFAIAAFGYNPARFNVLAGGLLALALAFIF